MIRAEFITRSSFDSPGKLDANCALADSAIVAQSVVRAKGLRVGEESPRFMAPSSPFK